MPVLPSADVAAGVAAYAARLGFATNGVWRDEAGVASFAIVSLGTITIALQRDPRACEITSARAPGGWAAYLYVADVEATCADMRARGARILREPEDAFYGCRDFDVEAPDGHVLAIGQDLAPSATGPGL